MYKWDCPICGNKNKGDFPTHDVCPICEWEDDPLQRKDPNYHGGANDLSQNEFRNNWISLNAKKTA